MADNDTIQGIGDILASFENINATVETKFTSKSDSGDNDVSSNLNKAKQWIQDTAYDITNKMNSLGTTIKTATNAVYDYASSVVKTTASDIVAPAKEKQNTEVKLFGNNILTDFLTTIDSISSALGDSVSNIATWLDENNFGSSGLGKALISILQNLKDQTVNYKDGVSETSFGGKMEESWYGNAEKSFLNYFQQQNSKSGSYKINILKSTPLDSNTQRDSLFGTMIMGTPYTFNQIADPNNRTMINTIVKDCKVVSFTPGMPKYYGSSALQDDANDIYKQTTNPNDMLSYLLRNGLDSSFAEKDKRYYTFSAKYDEYFAYLEAMLNPIWIKMGLSNGSDGSTFNLFSFFKIKAGDADGAIQPDKYKELLEQYNSSIGFYCNPASAVSESISNSKTGIGSSLKSDIDSRADYYQQLNYITGMGTGGSSRNIARRTDIYMQTATNIKDFVSQNFTSAKNYASAWSGAANGKLAKSIAGLAGFAAGAIVDATKIQSSQDLGAIIQSFATTNGMHVQYPELWADSTYSKNVNFNLTFMSPYGDPLSIFKYVYVPFCALLCLGLPRQAASNGYVSPFFVRADIPGMFTTDLGLISDITWTKGGAGNLWTKDGLPRAIDVTVTLTDLYEYLAMSKRMSFLSANPSYTVFLDNMAGLCTVTDGNSDDSLNDYFKKLINRISGDENSGNKLWNNFNGYQKKANYDVGNAKYQHESISKNLSKIPWFYNSSLV